MPKIVDHDERREEVANAVIDVVARSGVAGVTLKSVAEEAGWSTGVINHYFDSKTDLIVTAARHCLRQWASLDRRVATDDAVAALRDLIQAMVPIHERRMAITRAMIAFMGEAIADDALAEPLRAMQIHWRSLIADVLRRGVAAGEFAASLDVDHTADTLAALANGLAVRSAFESVEFEVQRGLVDRWIDQLVMEPATAGPASGG
jgi:AcrR family transcriptional regulator